MTTVEERPLVADEPDEPEAHEARGLLAFLTTTDHKRIGVAYMVTAFAFFLHRRLARRDHPRAARTAPTSHVVNESTYNQLFTMHGSIMLFLFLGAVRVRAGELPRADPDRRARHGVPPPQRA